MADEVTAGDPVAHTIVVGLDGSSTSQEALRWAARLARDCGAEILAVTAVTPLEDVIRDGVHFSPGDWRQDLRRRMHDEWCAALADTGVRFKVRLVERHPGVALLQAAEEAGADLIVVGVHQHRSLHGRLCSYLSQRATCPVIAVPPTATPAEAPEADAALAAAAR